MARIVRYVVGIEGLALLRGWLRDEGSTDERLQEIEAFLRDRASHPVLSLDLPLPEVAVLEGYASWAETYDAVPNPLIQLEEPVVRGIVDRTSPGRALDAACGTGRWAGELVARGHSVIGVDETPAMLERARGKVPSADLRLGRLESLPVDTASVDFAICALALAHCADLEPPIRELARVLRPGGRLVVTDLHPVNVIVGGGALFQKAGGGYGLVRGYAHGHGDYVQAFGAAGLEIARCVEPTWRDEDVALVAGGLSALAPEAFRSAIVGLPGALVWEVVRRGQ
ncbi:MAG: class I SAM-dependent methyltransferase [Candidatus Binatia bacterium]